MTEQEIKDAILEYIKEITNNDFAEGVPAPIELAVDKIYQGLDEKPLGVSSEALNGDISVSYENVGSLMTNPDINSLITPYKRMKW